MKEIGAELLLQTVKGLFAGNLVEVPQTRSDGNHQTGLKHAPKIFTETCQVDWNKPADEVFNLVRGLSPYPAAFTFLEGKKLKLYKVDKLNKVPGIPPGAFETDKKTFLQFACLDGYLKIIELQLEGKKKMMIEDFLRGYRWP
jgi:methionyl-tRNA formyltransferase